ncbi:MAG: DUF2760 domain-containing protein [Pirellulales bacterium]
MRLGLAFRAFFRTLGNAAVAEQVERVLNGETIALPPPRGREADAARPDAPASARPAPKTPARSEALTLLAALQREARFVDLVQESLDGYSDAQIGSAARDVLRDCRKTLDRMFSLQPLLAQPESAEVEVPAGYDPNRFHLTGQVVQSPPLRGQLVHPGWQATTCALPSWSGASDSALIVAPAEVEVR